MTSLAEPGLQSAPASVSETEGWGLILIPILLCLGMLVYGLVSQALPAQERVPTDRSCASSYEPRPGASC